MSKSEDLALLGRSVKGHNVHIFCGSGTPFSSALEIIFIIVIYIGTDKTYFPVQKIDSPSLWGNFHSVQISRAGNLRKWER